MKHKHELNVDCLIGRFKHAQFQSIFAIILGVGAGAAVLYVSLLDGNILSLPFSTSEHKDIYTVAGLQNLGNNCFLNVILQALACSRWFLSFLQTLLKVDNVGNDETDEKMPFTVALGSLLEELHIIRDEKLILNPRRVMLAMSSYISNFNLTRQQDASEALLHLLSALEEEISECCVFHDISLSDITAFHSKIYKPITEGQTVCERWKQHFVGPFDGTIGSSLTCINCSSMLSVDFEFFRCLPLPPVLDRSGEIMLGCSLVDCFKHFTAVEQVQNYRCIRCWHALALKYLSTKSEMDEEKIKKLENCVNLDACYCSRLFLDDEIKWTGLSCIQKQLSIGRCPKILSIHIQRAFMNVQGEFIKLQGHISFPLLFDIFPFTQVKMKQDQKLERKQINISLAQLHLPNVRQDIYLPRILNISSEKNPSETLSKSLLDKSTDEPLDNTGSHLHGQEVHSSFLSEQVANVVIPMVSKKCMYRLSSVVEHYGKPGSGHYAIYRRLESETSNRWFYVSDGQVSEVSEETVLAAEATLLFYDFLDTNV